MNIYQRSVEVAVGTFMVVGFAALAVLAIQVSGLSIDTKRDTYRIYAQFDDLGGLVERGRVSLSGITVGKVSSVTLDPVTYNALVEMEIYSDVNKLTVDTVASIQTAGLLGEKFIDLSVGGEEKFLADGDTIFDTQPALNLEKLISAFAAGR